MSTPKLGGAELAPGQSIPETLVNEIVLLLEQGACHFAVKDKDLATPPGSPAAGDAYIVAASPTGAWAGKAEQIAFYQSGTGWRFVVPFEGLRADVADEDSAYRYDGADWVPAISAAGGLLAANNLSDVASASAARGNLSVYSQAQVDALIAGLGASWKATVRAASTANVTLASAVENGDVLDGVTLATGDRILLKNQTTASENGIYVVAASGAPSRASDADTGAELVNAAVIVSEGTVNADTWWLCTTNAPITLGTTGLTFVNPLSGLISSFASAAEARAGSVSNKAIAPDVLHTAALPQTLTDGATISWDMSAALNAKVTLGGNRTIAAPTNPKEGITYALEVAQDGTGNRTVTWNAAFDFGSAGTPTLSTGASKRDFVFLYCYDASTPKFRASFSKAA